MMSQDLLPLDPIYLWGCSRYNARRHKPIRHRKLRRHSITERSLPFSFSYRSFDRKDLLMTTTTTTMMMMMSFYSICCSRFRRNRRNPALHLLVVVGGSWTSGSADCERCQLEAWADQLCGRLCCCCSGRSSVFRCAPASGWMAMSCGTRASLRTERRPASSSRASNIWSCCGRWET